MKIQYCSNIELPESLFIRFNDDRQAIFLCLNLINDRATREPFIP